MKLSKPISIIDVETTGLDTAKDRIITLAILTINPDGETVPKDYIFDPGIPIPKESTAIHGIADEDVKSCPPFSVAAPEIFQHLSGADLAGYNLINFDIPIIWEELYRCGFDWDLSKSLVVDAGNIFKKKEPRDLASAMKFYTGKSHEGAHEAMADVLATRAVLKGQLERYEDLAKMPLEQLAHFSKMDDRVDLAGVVVRNKDGVPVFNTKRNRGIPVADDIGYAEWMIYKADFPTETKRCLLRILEDATTPENAPQGEMF